jgi:hypothetical protein
MALVQCVKKVRLRVGAAIGGTFCSSEENGFEPVRMAPAACDWHDSDARMRK